MNIDISFAIAIQSDLEGKELIDFISEIVSPSDRITALVIKGMNNRFILDKNWSYDPKKINLHDGWLYYRYELSVYPINNTSLNKQKTLATLLISSLRNYNIKAELICDDDFEEK